MQNFFFSVMSWSAGFSFAGAMALEWWRPQFVDGLVPLWVLLMVWGSSAVGALLTKPHR